MDGTNLVEGSAGGNESLLDVMGRIARMVSDGHYTICAFTTNYRVSFSTPDGREAIGEMPVGRTPEEAMRAAIDAVCGSVIYPSVTHGARRLSAGYEVAFDRAGRRWLARR